MSLLFCFSSNRFIQYSYQFYFAFTLSALLISILLFLIISYKKQIDGLFIFLSFYCVYIFIHSKIWIKGNDDYTIFLFSGFLYFYSIYYFFKHKLIKPNYIFPIFIGIGIIQTIVCLFQYFGILESPDNVFKIIGTFNNPNITAMYIACISPFFVKNIFSKRRVIISSFCLFCSAFVLILINSRTSYLGVLTILIIFLIKEPSIRNKINSIPSKIRTLTFCISILLIILGGYCLYHNKQSSADGRLFIWEVSSNMVKKSPISGYGYGMFAKEYNLHQSEYIKNNTIDTTDKDNARYVYMAYNECINQLIQGGIIGLIFYLAFISFIAFCCLKLDCYITACLLSVIIMGIVNFTIDAIVVWLLFLTVAGYACSKSNITSLVNNKSILFTSIFIGIIVSSVLLYIQVNRLKAQIKLPLAEKYMEDKNLSEALPILEEIESKIGNYPPYMLLAGRAYILKKNYQEAICRLEKAKVYSSTPDLYLDLAFLYSREKRYEEAKDLLIIAKNMVPSYFRARYALLKVYLADKEKRTESIMLAQEILSSQYSKNNKDALLARDLAKKVLNLYNNK